MASNSTYRHTPASIVKEDINFSIPLYQRLFTWGENQVKQLMEDLHSHYVHKGETPYYLGMITVANQNDKFDLIDGQQRTTVLTLLAIAFMQTLPDGILKDQWTTFVNSAKRLAFKGRSQDRDFLKSLVLGETSNYQNKNMHDGLKLIKDYLKDNLKDKVEEFARFIYNYLTLFVTELPDHYVKNPESLNEYFEAMNSSGKSLEQHEILKVELLKNYSGEDKLNLTKLWNAVSNFEFPLINPGNSDDALNDQRRDYKESIGFCRHGKFEEALRLCHEQKHDEGAKMNIASIEIKKHDFNNKKYRDKESGIISFPEFLLTVLALHTGKDELARIHPTKLHETFRNNPIPHDEIVDFYHELLLYRFLLDFYVVRIKYGSSSSTHSLIYKQEEPEKEIHNRLKQFQSMLDVSTESHIWLLPFLKYLKSLDHEPKQIELLKFLMFNDMQRKGHSECPDLSNLDYDSKPRCWLWRLDYALWEKIILDGKNAFPYENLETEAIRQYEFRNNRSIEHLHPQNEDNNDTWAWDDVNSFGNLAMISSGFNSQQSNLPVHVKFANIEVQLGNKSLQSIKLYFMYLRAKRSEAEWTVTTKNEHSEEMLKILNESIEKVKSYGQE